MYYEFRLLPRKIPSSGILTAAVSALPRSRYRIEVEKTLGFAQTHKGLLERSPLTARTLTKGDFISLFLLS